MNSIDDKWKVILSLLRTHTSTIVPGTGYVSLQIPKEHFNLPFILAYSLLDEVLSEMRNNNVFTCSTWMLGAKMNASQTILPWVDYDVINDGKDKRNDLAHNGVLLSQEECNKYISAIGIELKCWGSLSST